VNQQAKRQNNSNHPMNNRETTDCKTNKKRGMVGYAEVGGL
jgi:hypothetical protein